MKMQVYTCRATSIRCSLAVVAALLLPAAAFAQDSSALPPLQTQGVVSYISGGIGSDESDAIKAVRSQFSLSLNFSARAEGRDAFLASVPVTIRDAAGQTILNVVSTGPFLLVKLPAGRYEISARYLDLDKKAVVNLVDGKSQSINLQWPALKSTEVRPAPAVPAVARVDAANDTALPASQTQAGVVYLSGGVGSDESAAIKAAAARYSLFLTFAGVQEGHNAFLSSVPLTVKDERGATILSLTSEGPYVLANVPPGSYRISASYKGIEKTAQVRVTAGQTARLSMIWQ